MKSAQGDRISVAFIHHANQFLITDGYENHEGISAIVGTDGSETGLLTVLRAHREYGLPLNLHLSGTLLESLLWHRPEMISDLGQLAKLDLVELVGSTYGQNMMNFFSYEHNLRQLKEELSLYESTLNWEAEKIRVFWPPERLWNTRNLAGVVTDCRLQNKGYRYVVVDDRLLYPIEGKTTNPRQLYDHNLTWDPANFQMYRIQDGRGLCALPIANNLRANIPPRADQELERVKTQLRWLLDINEEYNNELVAIYGDDMEKAAGTGGWDPDGPSQYESVLRWISEQRWIDVVKIGDWASARGPASERPLEPGSYVELVKEFGAGENYDRWYYDPRWARYRDYHAWSEGCVEHLEAQGADPALMELAWKTLLASAWETAWHTPRTGAHGEAHSEGGPSAWTKAIASHSRLAAIIAEAAYWMNHKDDTHAHAYRKDLDNDGYSELVLRSGSLFAVFSPENGGRLVYLFSVSDPPGRLVVGNPIDDWNLMEELHGFMQLPRNHPGAFSDLGYEHDYFRVNIQAPVGNEVRASLRNVQEGSSAFGLEKIVNLAQGENHMQVEYSVPDHYRHRHTGRPFSTEIGLSPDYLQLLREGRRGLKELTGTPDFRGLANKDLAVWARLQGTSAFWDHPRQAGFGHGYVLRAASFDQRFTIWLGVEFG